VYIFQSLNILVISESTLAIETVKTEVEDESDSGPSPVGEPEGNWSLPSSNSSIPGEFVANLSMEYSDTQECPHCRCVLSLGVFGVNVKGALTWKISKMSAVNIPYPPKDYGLFAWIFQFRSKSCMG
jgi:hypothetical protein